MAGGLPGASGEKFEPKYSVVDFPEFDQYARISSPRSIKACGREGVEPADLIHRPMEEFAERAMSPRLVKLRYDFFEAKRRDLLTAVRRARGQMVMQEERVANSKPHGADRDFPGSPDSQMKQHGLSLVAAASAKESDTIALERHKLQRVQEMERKWLQGALGRELTKLRELEENSQRIAQEEADNSKASNDQSQRRKMELERKRQLELQKAAEQAAQLRLERQLMKEELEREAQARERANSEAKRAKKEKYQRDSEAAEKKREAERAKQAAQERAFQRQQERIREMEDMDEERRKAQEENREELRRVMRQKIEAKHARIQKSVENNVELERQRERDFQMRQEKERERNQRLQDERDLMQEQSAKKQLHMMLKRKCIADEAAGMQEQKRNDMLDHMESVENRLGEHEMKKERYLEFKRELTSLKEKNKELNVQRQRRRQEHRRELLAESARQKATKMDFVQLERQRLWDDRRRTALMSQAYRDRVREIVHNQKLASQFDSAAVEQALVDVLRDPAFNPTTPKQMGKSKSSPSMSPPKMDA